MLNKNDAMGIANFQRGFSDASLYVAYNTRSKVTPVSVSRTSRKLSCDFDFCVSNSLS